MVPFAGAAARQQIRAERSAVARVALPVPMPKPGVCKLLNHTECASSPRLPLHAEIKWVSELKSRYACSVIWHAHTSVKKKQS